MQRQMRIRFVSIADAFPRRIDSADMETALGKLVGNCTVTATDVENSSCEVWPAIEKAIQNLKNFRQQIGVLMPTLGALVSVATNGVDVLQTESLSIDLENTVCRLTYTAWTMPAGRAASARCK